MATCICLLLLSSIQIFLSSQTKDFTVFKGHGASVDQLCWNPRNPDLLATASGDKTVRIWDARTNKEAARVNTSGEEFFFSFG